MNALDVQNVLVANLNALAGLPVSSSTIHRYKTNLLKSVKDIAETGAPIHLDMMTETQTMQLCGSGLVLLHIFYAMCLHWVPKVTIINGDIITNITKDNLISNERYPLNLGPFVFYIRGGELEIVVDVE